jgi:hypothetical protein
MHGWFALIGAASAAGIALANGSGWWPWAAAGSVLGLLHWVFRSRKFLAWNVRQNYPTDDVLRRGASAVQRDGIRTDGEVGMKREPYWPNAPDER